MKMSDLFSSKPGPMADDKMCHEMDRAFAGPTFAAPSHKRSFILIIEREVGRIQDLRKQANESQ